MFQQNNESFIIKQRNSKQIEKTENIIKQDYVKKNNSQDINQNTLYQTRISVLGGQYVDNQNKTEKSYLEMIQDELYNNKIINSNDLNKQNVWNFLNDLQKTQNISYTSKIQSVEEQGNMLFVKQQQGIADFIKVGDMINQYCKLANSNQQKNERFIQTEQFLLFAFNSLFAKLKAMHEQGIAHGDIKPQNMIITKDVKCYFVDFDQAVQVQKNLEDYLSVWTPYYNCQTVQTYIKNKQKNKLCKKKEIVFLIDRIQFLISFIRIICLNKNSKSQFNQQKLNEVKQQLLKDGNYKFAQKLFDLYDQCELELNKYLIQQNDEKIQTTQIKLIEKNSKTDIKQNNFTWFLIGIKENESENQINYEQNLQNKDNIQYDIEVISLNRIISFYLNYHLDKQIKFSDDLHIPEFLNINCDDLRNIKQRLIQECGNIDQINGLSVLSYFHLFMNKNNVKISINSQQQLRKFIESLYLYPTIQKLNLDVDKTNKIDEDLILKIFQTLENIPQINSLQISLINQQINQFSKIIEFFFNQNKHVRFKCSQIIQEDLKDDQGFEINKKIYQTESCILQLMSSSINDKYLKFICNIFQKSLLQYLSLDLSLNDQISTQSIVELIKCTQNIKTLKKLRLNFSSCKNFNQDCIVAIIEILKLNRKIDFYFNIQFCSNISTKSFKQLLDFIVDQQSQMNYTIQIRHYFIDYSDINQKIKKIRKQQNKKVKINNKLCYYK